MDKKILHITPFGKRAGGHIQILNLLVEHLNWCNLECEILSLSGKYSRVSNNIRVSKPRNSFNIFLYLIKNVLLLRKYKIIHFHTIWNAWLILIFMLGVISRTPIVVSLHGNLLKNTFTGKRLKKNLFLILLTPFSISKNISIHVLTSREQEELPKQFCKWNIIKIPNGVERVYKGFPIKKPIETRYLYVGEISSQKGIDILIKSLAKIEFFLVKKNIKIVINLVGRINANFNENLLYKKFNNIEIIYHGEVENKLVGDFYKTTDWFILLSRSEGMSISLIDALSYGVPIIISNQSDFANLEQKNIGITTKLNTNSVSKSFIESLIIDSNLYSLYKNNAIKYAKKNLIFSKIVTKYVDFYNQLLDKRSTKSDIKK